MGLPVLINFQLSDPSSASLIIVQISRQVLCPAVALKPSEFLSLWKWLAVMFNKDPF